MACSAGVAQSVPTSSSLPEVSGPPLSYLSAVCRSAATASPPVRADFPQSTPCQGRAGGGEGGAGAFIGVKRRALTGVLDLGSRTEAAS